MLKIYPENVEANRSNKKKGKVDRRFDNADFLNFSI